MSAQTNIEQQTKKELTENMRIYGILSNGKIVKELINQLNQHKEIMFIVSYENYPNYLGSIWFKDTIPPEVQNLEEKFEKIDKQAYLDKLLLHQDTYDKMLSNAIENNYVNISLQQKKNRLKEKKERKQNAQKDKETNIIVNENTNDLADLLVTHRQRVNVVITGFATFNDDNDRPIPSEMCMIKIRNGQIIGTIHEIFSLTKNQFKKLKDDGAAIKRSFKSGILFNGVKGSIELNANNISQLKKRIEDFYGDAEHCIIAGYNKDICSKLLNNYFKIKRNIKIESYEIIYEMTHNVKLGTLSQIPQWHRCCYHDNFDESIKCEKNFVRYLADRYIQKPQQANNEEIVISIETE